MVVKLAWRRHASPAAHDRVSVFVGTDRGHLAKVGELTLRREEAERFRYSLRMGIQEPGFTGIFESGWPTR